MSPHGSQRFEFGGGVRLEAIGGRADLRHLHAEYGPATTGGLTAPDLRISFGRTAREPAAATIEGFHKTVGWRVGLGDPEARPLTAELQLRGRPRWFCRSLVQGYFVEPLIELAAVPRGRVLLPGAAFARNGGAVVLIGRSGSGKSTVMARMAADGVAVLGDDHVMLDGAGVCWPFPRRVRLYADIRETAPGAYRGMSARRRSALAARGAVRRLSAGAVAPPLAIAPGELASGKPPAPLPVATVYVVARDERAERVEREPLRLEEAVSAAAEVLELQRSSLARASADWDRALERAAALERATLADALARAHLERLRVPNRLPAAEAIAALHEQLVAA